jgi:hypothetical protein
LFARKKTGTKIRKLINKVKQNLCGFLASKPWLAAERFRAGMLD